MAHQGQGRGRGGRDQSNQPGHNNPTTSELAIQRHRQKTMRKSVQEVERMYRESINEDIRRLIK